MSKGTRREREASELFEQAGYETYRPATVQFGENDILGLFDMIAMKPTEPPWYIQVKSNGARGINKWAEQVRQFFPFDHGRACYLVPYDNAGWRLIRIGSEEGYRVTVLDERDSSTNMGEDIVEFLEA